MTVTGATTAAAQLVGVGNAAKMSSLQLANMALAGAAVVGAALIGAGVASVKMAADYQQSMNKVQALTGASGDQMKQYDTGLKSLAVDAGVAPKALSEGLYNVISAGYKGKDAMTVLTLATQDSKIGMTDAATATNALTNVMANFKTKTADANVVNGEMLQTVTLGKATFSDYANNITKASSTSAQYGENMQTMNAAWATLTASGIKAGMATTDYDQSLKVMDGNIGKVSTSLHKNGIAFDETAFNTMSYGQKVSYLNAALQQARDKHVAITGATVQASQAIKTISDHIGMYNSNLSALSDKAAMAAKTQQAWGITQNGFNQQMSRAGAAVQVLMINIGSKLLPVLTQLVGAVTPIITNFTKWITTGDRLKQFLDDASPKMVLLKIGLIALAGVFGGIAVFALTAFAIAAWAALVPMLPFIAIGVGVALAIAGIILVIKNWGAIMNWVGGVFSGLGSLVRGIATAIKNDVGNAFSGLGTAVRGAMTGIKNDVGNAFNGLGTNIRNAMTTVKNDVGSKFNDLGTQMRQSATKIKNDVGGAFSGLGTTAHNAGQGVVAAGQWMYAHNTYWKAAVDFVVKVFDADKALVLKIASDIKTGVGNFFDALGTHLRAVITTVSNFVGNTFNALGSLMRTIATTVKNDVGNAFNALGSAVSSAITNMKNTVGNLFSALGSLIRGVMNAIQSNVLNAIGQAVGGFMSGMGSLVSGAAGELATLGGNFASAMGGLAGQAVAWGANIIQGIINGIGSMLSNLGGMASKAAGMVAGALGFHSPTKFGPGSDADTWMPNLMNMLSKGLMDNMPQMKNAAMHVASSLQPLIQTNVNASLSGGGSIPMSTSSSGATIVIQPPNIILDGQRLTNTQMPYIINAIRTHTGVII